MPTFGEISQQGGEGSTILGVNSQVLFCWESILFKYLKYDSSQLMVEAGEVNNFHYVLNFT